MYSYGPPEWSGATPFFSNNDGGGAAGIIRESQGEPLAQSFTELRDQILAQSFREGSSSPSEDLLRQEAKRKEEAEKVFWSTADGRSGSSSRSSSSSGSSSVDLDKSAFLAPLQQRGSSSSRLFGESESSSLGSAGDDPPPPDESPSSLMQMDTGLNTGFESSRSLAAAEYEAKAQAVHPSWPYPDSDLNLVQA